MIDPDGGEITLPDCILLSSALTAAARTCGRTVRSSREGKTRPTAGTRSPQALRFTPRSAAAPAVCEPHTYWRPRTHTLGLSPVFGHIHPGIVRGAVSEPAGAAATSDEARLSQALEPRSFG